MGKRSCLALALALCLTVCAPSVRAADPAAAQTAPVSQGWLLPEKKAAPAYPDTLGAWCSGAADTVSRAGLMEGYYDGTFGPQRALTNAQSAAVCARLHSLLTGGDGNIPLLYDDAPWYAGYYLYLDRALGTDSSLRDRDPGAGCRRVDFAQAVGDILTAAGIALPEKNTAAAIPDVDLCYASPAVPALYRAGVMNGTDAYGTFAGEQTLTRGQAAAILARLTDPAQRISFTPKSFDLCRDILQLPGDTVLATVDGQPVTAADFGLQLVTSLLQWGDKTTADACADALRLYKAAVSAPLFLAASLRLSLTDAEGAAARSNAEAEAGCLGCKAEYYETRQTVLALCGKLESYYAARDGHDGKTADASYHAALDDAAAALILKPAPALAALDLSAVRARALSAPLGTWLGLS